MSFEWEQLQDEGHAIFGGGENAKRIDVPDTDPILMKELATIPKGRKSLTKNMFPFFRAPVMAVHTPTWSRNLSPPSLKAGIQPSTPTCGELCVCGNCRTSSAMDNGKRITIPDFE